MADTDDPRQTFERYLDETMSIARTGESRADRLDTVGFVLVVLAVVGVISTVGILSGIDSPTTQEWIGTIAGGVVFTVSCLVGATLAYGFGALVRNSARSLELQALDSNLAD